MPVLIIRMSLKSQNLLALRNRKDNHWNRQFLQPPADVKNQLPASELETAKEVSLLMTALPPNI